MNENVISKIVKFIIYILIFILISLICYNIHLLYKNFFITTPPPKNSVRVSPLTGEPITNVNSSNDIIKIIYNNTQNQYGSLSRIF